MTVDLTPEEITLMQQVLGAASLGPPQNGASVIPAMRVLVAIWDKLEAAKAPPSDP